MEVFNIKNINLIVEGIFNKKIGIYRIECIMFFKNFDIVINCFI